MPPAPGDGMARDGATQGATLSVETTDTYPSATFDAFFAEYDKAFILPAEKEEEAGFAACLALNHGAAHAALTVRYGPFREVVLVVRDEPGGPVVGGANYIATRIELAGQAPLVTANLNYIFTTAAGRGRGYMRPLLRIVRDSIAALPFADGLAPLIFLEQNDPFRMTPEAYARDTRHAGTDQFDRLLIWARTGARILDIDYLQPGLSADQPADDTLAYALLDPPAETLDPTMLAAHLERFFAISVFKGEPLSATAASMVADLRHPGAAPVRLFDPTPLLTEIAARTDRWSSWPTRPKSLRHALGGGVP